MLYRLIHWNWNEKIFISFWIIIMRLLSFCRKIKDVIARRAQVQRALESATGELWSTKEKGFGGTRKLQREISYP